MENTLDNARIFIQKSKEQGKFSFKVDNIAQIMCDYATEIKTVVQHENGTTGNCVGCSFLKQKRLYTGDSFETAFDWFCTKKHNKKIAGYVEWHEEKKVQLPDWCPKLA